MGYLEEYINKGFTLNGYFEELQRLVEQYNKITGRYLYLYVAAMFKRVQGISMEEDDFYIFRDMLQSVHDFDEIDVYIETPGGNGVTAEQIAKFLHSKFKKVNFVISGEAKSAGTILAMAGNEIYMTETGSLGPIDAQVPIGRTVVSAYDYMDWISNKMKEAQITGRLNPVDATMIAQITPGEIQLVNHSLEFAKDLVKEWLQNYKFDGWNKTETRQKIVTDQMKNKRAKKVAAELANHSRWRTHGRSLGIDDLESIGIKVVSLEDKKEIAEIIYRIQFVCKLIQETSSIYKIFFSKDEKIFKTAVAANIQNNPPQGLPQGIPHDAKVVQIDIPCAKCGRRHKFFKKLVDNNNIDVEMEKQNVKPLPKEDSFTCDCGNVIDLKAVKNDLDMLPKIK